MSSTAAAFEDLIHHLTPRHGPGEARSIARIVLEDAFSWRPGRRDRELDAAEEQRLHDITRRLLTGEPVQYILGEADFFGLKVNVTPAVLIPRPETEELVEWVIETIKNNMHTSREIHLLDIGTGSGCIPVAVKKKLPRVQVEALDVSAEALAVARSNAVRNGVEVTYYQLDILKEEDMARLPRYDVIVSNPPYIPHAEAELMPEHVRQYEPHLALFVPDVDPLLFYRRIAESAPDHLQPSGFVFFECNEHHTRKVRDLLAAAGFAQVELRRDLQGKERMVRGRL